MISAMACFVSLLPATCWSCSEQKRAEIMDFPTAEFQEGDLAFRRGRSFESRAVLEADSGGLYSHVGILARRDGQWRVVHAVPGEREEGDSIDRVKVESLEAFFRFRSCCHRRDCAACRCRQWMLGGSQGFVEGRHSIRS